MDDLISEFITETSEALAVLDMELIKLEQNPNDREILSNIFRLVHTIKGTCGFLGLPRLESVAHSGENVLGKIRDGKIPVSETAISLTLESLDAIRDLVEYLTDHGEEPEGDDADLNARLDAFAASNGESTEVTAPATTKEAPIEAASTEVSEDKVEAEEAPIEGGGNMTQEELDALERAFMETESEIDIEPDTSYDIIEDDTAEAVDEDSVEEAMEAAAPEPAPAMPATTPAVSEAARKVGIEQGMKVDAGGDPSKEKDAVSATANQSIRVNLGLIEYLMQMVGELVLTRNQLIQIVRNKDDAELTTPLQQLSHITTELQEGVMKTRMQPIGNAWSKFPRLIRDLSLELDKKIELKMIGEDTELDRQLLDMIKDPLTHMVRNSCDHGLEGPKDRMAAGKSEVGTVTLHAYHEGGHIIVDIKDDGRGINIEKVKEKALENGVATAEDMANMTDKQIMQFIFAAGFSTAEKVTNVSGRGVGMDVVRTNIEKIGGNVELASEPGKGSTFHIKIPLTLAIVSVLVVESAEQKFAIPQINVLELVRAEKESGHRIEHINDAPVLRLREKLLPLITLSRILEIEDEKEAHSNTHDAPQEIDVESMVDDAFEKGHSAMALEHALEASKPQGAAGFIVVCAIGGYEFGVIVDNVFDTEEIVVKPVCSLLSDIDVYSGNTILGDGSVIMILDPNGLARRTGNIMTSSDANDMAQGAMTDDEQRMIKYLLFSSGGGAPKAVPLELVSRLENIDVVSIEHSTGKPVVQYRGGLMRLRTLPGKEIPESGLCDTIVFTYDNHAVGLIVDEVNDIVEGPLDIQSASAEDAFIGSLVIANKTTDIVDIGYMLADLINSRDGASHYGEKHSCLQGKKVLVVEDSPFFQKLLVPSLEELGCKVSTADSGQDAIMVMQGGFSPDIVITDIEMPGMDGFELTEALKQSHPNLPVIAFTSTVNQQFIAKAEQLGMTDIVLKTDRAHLIQTLSDVFSPNDALQEVA